ERRESPDADARRDEHEDHHHRDEYRGAEIFKNHEARNDPKRGQDRHMTMPEATNLFGPTASHRRGVPGNQEHNPPLDDLTGLDREIPQAGDVEIDPACGTFLGDAEAGDVHDRENSD